MYEKLKQGGILVLQTYSTSLLKSNYARKPVLASAGVIIELMSCLVDFRSIMSETELEIWYHDEAEVDQDLSWVANSPYLRENAKFRDYGFCRYSKVLSLVEYTRPDFILTVNGVPYLSTEVTEMNPSGHNMPQRFSCLLRASEVGVPSLFYYPEYARRTVSDPAVRYLNVRVPLAQMKMSNIFKVPSLSMPWPTGNNNLPSTKVEDHAPLAEFVEYVAKLALDGTMISNDDSTVLDIVKDMKRVAHPNSPSSYDENKTYRAAVPKGETTSYALLDYSIDPPLSCEVKKTNELLKEVYARAGKRVPSTKKLTPLKNNEYCLVYTGTANKSKTGPEHPYPGYLTLLDILYLRTEDGQTTKDREMNLVFVLPISLESYKANAINRPTGLNILMEFADIIVLEDAAVLCGWMRNITAGAVLVEW